MPGRTPLHLPALSATVLRPAFLPPNQECSIDSSGLPDPLPPSDDLDWGPPCFPCDFLLRSSTTAGASSFPVNFPSTSASTSFASRCTGPRAFVRSNLGSLRCEDLLCFFKVDLLFHVIAR